MNNIQGNDHIFILTPLKIVYDIKIQDNIVCITPSGDLTAAGAEVFRTILMKLYDDGNTGFCFDLKNVCDIDSVSLGVLFSFGRIVKDRNDPDTKNENKPLLANAGEQLFNFLILTGLDLFYSINRTSCKQ